MQLKNLKQKKNYNCEFEGPYVYVIGPFAFLYPFKLCSSIYHYFLLSLLSSKFVARLYYFEIFFEKSQLCASIHRLLPNTLQ